MRRAMRSRNRPSKIQRVESIAIDHDRRGWRLRGTHATPQLEYASSGDEMCNPLFTQDTPAAAPLVPDAAPLLRPFASDHLDERSERSGTFTKQEEDLHALMSAHPMMSANLLSSRCLQAIVDMQERVPVKLLPLPVVGKRYEDSFLRPVDATASERPCIMGAECLCLWLAARRHGSDDTRCFVCTEFLLPQQQQEWHMSGRLPTVQGKCLMCIRFLTTTT